MDADGDKEAIDGSQGKRSSDSVDSRQGLQGLVSGLTTERSIDSVAPLFSFGVITDVQYADIPDGASFLGTPRFYRHALEVLNRAVANWNQLGRVIFAIHFGDLVDGLSKDESHVAFDKVLAGFNAFHGGSVYHMIGNHCLYNLPRVELNQLLKIPPSPDERSYYEFSPYPGFRFVVLDGYDISVLGWPEEHPKAQMAIRLLDKINPNEDKNSPIGLKGDMARFVKFNGGLGNDQLSWLDHVLHTASLANEKTIVCCHLPLHPATLESPSALCWNYVDVLVTLQKYSCVVACLSGHAHTGGYTIDSHGIHYVVLEAVLECPPEEDAFGVIDVFPDRLSLAGRGRMTSRDMYFRQESSI
ncbi:unnamed protein product [Calypogeia fissa]